MCAAALPQRRRFYPLARAMRPLFGGGLRGGMRMHQEIKLDLGSLRELYKSGAATPTDVIATVYDRLSAQPLEPVWSSVVPREKALARARNLQRDPTGSVRPLYGVPFAIQDYIDLAGL